MEKMNIEKVKGYISEMYSIKPLYSNYFNQTLTLDDYYSKTTHTLLVAKPFSGYNRIYVLTSDLEDAAKELNALEGIQVVNIPSKGDITAWEQLLIQSGFKLIGVYERFYNTRIRMREEIGTLLYAEHGQEEEIYHLFHDHGFFSIYMDYLPSIGELKQMIEQKSVIINVTDSKIQGALTFSIKGQKCYFGAWIDQSTNGLKLLFDAYNILVSKNVTYANLWINSKNNKVKSISRLTGAKPDGLKDYTFIKYNIMKQQIIEILTEIRPEFDFNMEADFILSGMLDSFDVIALVNTLDEKFGISIDGVDVLPENFSSIEKIENLLKKNGIK